MNEPNQYRYKKVKPRSAPTQADEALGFAPSPLRQYTSVEYTFHHEKLKRFWVAGRFDRDAFMVACGALTAKGAVILPDGENPPRLARAYHFLSWYMGEHERRNPKLEAQHLSVDTPTQNAVSSEIEPIAEYAKTLFDVVPTMPDPIPALVEQAAHIAASKIDAGIPEKPLDPCTIPF